MQSSRNANLECSYFGQEHGPDPVQVAQWKVNNTPQRNADADADSECLLIIVAIEAYTQCAIMRQWVHLQPSIQWPQRQHLDIGALCAFNYIIESARTSAYAHQSIRPIKQLTWLTPRPGLLSIKSTVLKRKLQILRNFCFSLCGGILIYAPQIGFWAPKKAHSA